MIRTSEEYLWDVVSIAWKQREGCACRPFPLGQSHESGGSSVLVNKVYTFYYPSSPLSVAVKRGLLTQPGGFMRRTTEPAGPGVRRPAPVCSRSLRQLRGDKGEPADLLLSLK